VARHPRRAAAVALLAPLLLAACGDQPQLSVAGLGLPDLQHPSTLASTTYRTSPDGGIYQNPDPLTVTLVGRIPMQPLARTLGAQSRWATLAAYGPLTVVGFQLHNAGLAGSDPQLNSLQVASDLSPTGASPAIVSRFYYPAYPLAGLSTVPIDGQCTVHLDPGQTVTVVLVYPPIRSTTYVTWGEYGDFAIAIPLGGAIPVTGTLRANLCTPPNAQPSP
jgi:hypothetical protein